MLTLFTRAANHLGRSGHERAALVLPARAPRYEVDPNGYQTESEYEDTEKHALLKRINAYRGDGFISYSVSS